LLTNADTVAKHLLIEKYETIVNGYVGDVLSGRIITGQLEQAAAQRYLDDLESNGERFVLNKYKAARACKFFSNLRLTQGSFSGKRFHLQPIQAFCVWNIFGWDRLDEPYRRFREAYLTFGRGNGKTPFGAGMAIMCSGFDDPQCDRAEVYLTATKRDQAKLSYQDVSAFIVKSGLDGRYQIYRDEIRIPRTGSVIKPLPADSKTSDGLRIYFLLRDEVHAWQEQHREFYNVLETGLGKYDQDLAVTITTAGDDHSVLWKEQDSVAENVVRRDRSYTQDSLFVMICRLDDDDDPFEVDNYHKSNPLMRHGVVKRQKIEKLINEARLIPSKKRALLRYYGNCKVESGSKSFTEEMWNRCVVGPNRKMPALVGVPHGGLDMGQTDDLAAVAYCWQLADVEVQDRDEEGLPIEDDDGNPVLIRRPTYAFNVEIFCAKGNLRVRKEPFAQWIADSWITVTNSQWTDPNVVYESISSRVTSHGIASIGMDPNNTRQMALDVFNNQGVHVEWFKQSCEKFNEPLRELRRAMLEGRVFFEDNPCLEWCFGNVIERENPAGHVMPDKRASVEKIDPAVACLMAFSEVMFGEKEKTSVYEDRGAITL